MSARYRVELTCDAPECSSWCAVDVSNADLARAQAASTYGWSQRDGDDLCPSCTREGGAS